MVRSSVVFLGLLAGAAPAQQPPAGVPWANKLFLPDITQNPTQPPPPVLVHNFGTVPAGTVCAHRFTLTNIYQTSLQVVGTDRNSVRLVPYPPQRVLQSTETAEFGFTLDTLGLPPGRSVHTLKADVIAGGTDAQHQSPAFFRFEVDVRADVSITPGELAFGTVLTGEAKSASVVLDYHGRQPGWRVAGVRPTSGPLDVRVDPAGPGKYRLTATLRPTAAAGQLAERVSLTTSDPNLPVVEVPVSGVVLAQVTVSAEVVRFDKPVKVGEKDKFAVILRSNNRAFQVQGIVNPGDGVSVETFGFPGPTQRVEVCFEPAKPGAVRKELRLETDLPGRPAVTIRVEAVGE